MVPFAIGFETVSFVKVDHLAEDRSRHGCFGWFLGCWIGPVDACSGSASWTEGKFAAM